MTTRPLPLSAQVFALIVFSCIFGEGYSNTHESKQKYCVFNHNEDACRYASAIGVLAFLASACFLVVDVYFPQISNVTDRKYLVIGDLLFSGNCQQCFHLILEGERSSVPPTPGFHDYGNSAPSGGSGSSLGSQSHSSRFAHSDF